MRTNNSTDINKSEYGEGIGAQSDVRSERAQISPPVSDKGGDDLAFVVPDDWKDKAPVITGDIDYGLHWLTVTVFCEKVEAFKLYMDLFYDTFGELIELGHGLAGYKSVMVGLFGFKLAYDPGTFSKRYNSPYESFIFPGAACECLGPEFIKRFFDICVSRNIPVNCTRIDYKFDQCNFSPYQFRWMLSNSVVHLVANRKKIRHIQNDEDNEIGNKGRMSVYVGSNSSDRLICCYDTHGFTRLEMRNKGERARDIFLSLAVLSLDEWNRFLIGILQDYIYFDTDLWRKFVGENKRAYMKLQKKGDPTLDELEKSFVTQWAAAVSTLYDIKGPEWFDNVLKVGREKRVDIPKYGVILHRYGLNEEDLAEKEDD
jgi:hypothetical protein